MLSDELKLLGQHTLSKAAEARGSILQKDTDVDVDMASESDSQG
jgi:hypothetical protein